MPRNRIKRQQVATDDGWTVITHGLANVSLDSDKSKNKAAGGGGQGKTKAKGEGKDDGKKNSMFTLPDVVSDITPDKLLAEFQGLQRRWAEFGVARQIDGIFGGNAGGGDVEGGEEDDGKESGEKEDWDIREAICIGIGSFSRDWAHRWRSLWQLVLFVHVVGKVTAKGAQAQPIACYATDPAFTQIDTEFLSLLEITTLPSSQPPTSSPSPSPSSVITPQTFLYSPFVDWFLLLPTFLKGKDPAVYIGNEILSDYTLFAQTTEKRDMLETCNEVGRKWLERRRCVKLKEGVGVGASASALGGLVVYLREGEGIRWRTKPQDAPAE
ncbi:SRR1 multi-domain protein [Pyrenophora teres f. maculata]|nr:SRR1 multi-domain protein [Pyrenophora teres f. maculata]